MHCLIYSLSITGSDGHLYRHGLLNMLHRELKRPNLYALPCKHGRHYFTSPSTLQSSRVKITYLLVIEQFDR